MSKEEKSIKQFTKSDKAKRGWWRKKNKSKLKK